AQTQLGALRLAPARLPGQTGQYLPPTSLLTLPGQPGHNAQAILETMPVTLFGLAL
ncbi:hypothetical protein XENOCAPTIV_017715, partial [Xenoophorus captivus]